MIGACWQITSRNKSWENLHFADTRQRLPTTGSSRTAKLTGMKSPKETMFDQSGQWIHLETFDEFDNGLSELIDLWSSTSKATTQAVKASALARFKEDLEAATLHWIDNRAKSKKYAAIAKELAEFEDALK